MRSWKKTQISANDLEELDRFPEADNFVLIRFQINKNKKSVYYVGKILEPKDDDGNLKFLS
jgi:hypothetical protein